MGWTPNPQTPPPRQGLAIASLVLGLLGLPTLGCLGVGALLSVIFGIIALVRAGREPQRYGGKGFAIGGIVASALSILVAPFIGIIAAIAIPSLLRARILANEAGAIGDVRTVLSGQAAYQGSNCGAYGPLECLAAPSAPGCLPNHPAGSATFLDPEIASLQTRRGYTRSFYSGSPVEGCPGGRAYNAFAYVAVPASKQTGVRGFCGDATGIVCVTADGSSPMITEGRCPDDCAPLR